MPDGRPIARTPEFSIVIPTRNRPEQLRRCLSALEKLESTREEFEVIVVDDGSSQSYDHVVAEFAAQMRIRLLRQEWRGPGQARNAGAAIAAGRFVALTDDDCAPAPDWLSRLGDVLRERPDALAGGRIVNAMSGHACSVASQVLLSYLYDYFGGREHKMRFFASCNFALSTELYRKMGGFDPRFRLAGGEDRDFCDRWTWSNKPLVYVPDAVVHHFHRLSLRGFLRQHFNYGRGAWHFHRMRAERGAGRVQMEPMSFLTGMIARPFRERHVRMPLVVSVLIGSSVVMNALGYAFEGAQAASSRRD